MSETLNPPRLAVVGCVSPHSQPLTQPDMSGLAVVLVLNSDADFHTGPRLT